MTATAATDPNEFPSAQAYQRLSAIVTRRCVRSSACRCTMAARWSAWSASTLDGPDSPHTVLYADDNALNVELVLEMLRPRPGLRVVVVRNGHDAITLARREQPDLLLLDMHLGDLSGLDVMQTLARDPALSHVPCIALSADAMPASIELAERTGFKAYLTRPLNVNGLLHCIGRILAHRE